MPLINKLEDLIKNGLIRDIFHAEMNLSIFKRIADNIEFLKTTHPEDQKLFGYLQVSANNQIILALSRLFDKPSKKFPTRCILSFLDLIKAEKDNFPKIIELHNTVQCLYSYHPTSGAIDYLIEAVGDDDPSVFPYRFYQFYSTEYIQAEIQDHLIDLKIFRDKFIAHNEVFEIQGFQGIENSGIIRLLEFAQEIVSVIGWAYFSTVYHTNGNYLLSENAKQRSYFVKHLIDKMKKDEV